MNSGSTRGKQTEQERRVIRARDGGANKGDNGHKHKSKSEERK